MLQTLIQAREMHALFHVHHDSVQIPSVSGVSMPMCTQAGLFPLLSVSLAHTGHVPLSYIKDIIFALVLSCAAQAWICISVVTYDLFVLP